MTLAMGVHKHRCEGGVALAMGVHKHWCEGGLILALVVHEHLQEGDVVMAMGVQTMGLNGARPLTSAYRLQMIPSLP